ncbi:MAG TPA: hypothetical protein VHY09_09650, partial [Candidatus Methylacidiphilales bacterium]|nr:hypothetical protein [Candidatus Methylacidiphilales bacterium]
RDLEKEAPPLTAEEVAKPDAPPRSTPVAPPRTTPAVPANTAASSANSATVAQKAANTAGIKTTAATGVTPSATGQKVNIDLNAQHKATVSAPAANASTSPHPTRPATLYYTSQPKKEATDSMKTTPTAGSAATPTSSSSAARPANAANASAAATRPAAATTANSAATARPSTLNSTTASRPTGGGFDYRANVERQSREQKSVGSILSYFVYGLIAVFVIGAGLATYGSVVIFGQLHDHATSISGLDAKYAQKDADLTKTVLTMQDTLSQANATIARQQDLLSKQEEEINQLRTAINTASSASADAIHAESRARAQEAANLRARIRDLEYKTSIQTTTGTAR